MTYSSDKSVEVVDEICCQDSETPCSECCEHFDLEDAQCLDCGKDMTEELSARAYDRAKDRD